jgi:hypothetical protein
MVRGMAAACADIIEQVVGTYREAAEANRRTAGRRGNLIELAPGEADELLVSADLHGHRLNFKRLQRIADLDHHPGRHLVLQEVLHGGPTYPSGQGCMSHLLLEDVARWKIRYPQRLHFLLSNHELSELTDFPITKGGRILNLQLRIGMQEQYGSAAEAVRDAAMDFVASCPLAVRLANGIFVCHSTPANVDTEGFDVDVFRRPLTPADLAAGGDVFRLVWGRDFRDENAAAFAAMVNADILLLGHEPCARGYWVPNRHQIILDCCGQNACYVLLPTGEKLTQSRVVQRIRSLHERS